MSLLLCFFVLLVALGGSQKTKEASDALLAIKGGFGILPANVGAISLTPRAAKGKVNRQTLEQIARSVAERMQVLGRERDIKIEFEKGGLKIVLPSQILFATASADLSPEAVPILTSVGEVLREVLGESRAAVVEVRGHTDSRPLTSSQKFDDNFDLSFGRAKSVMTQVKRLSGIPDENFEVIGLGPSQPKATNDTDEGRAVNRRVEIFIRGELRDTAAEQIEQRFDTMTQEEPAPTGADAGVTEPVGIE